MSVTSLPPQTEPEPTCRLAKPRRALAWPVRSDDYFRTLFLPQRWILPFFLKIPVQQLRMMIAWARKTFKFFAGYLKSSSISQTLLSSVWIWCNPDLNTKRMIVAYREWDARFFLSLFCYKIWDLWDSKMSTSPNKMWDLWDSKKSTGPNKNKVETLKGVLAQTKINGPLRLKKYKPTNFEDWSKQNEVWRVLRQARNDRHTLSSLRRSVRILGII